MKTKKPIAETSESFAIGLWLNKKNSIHSKVRKPKEENKLFLRNILLFSAS